MNLKIFTIAICTFLVFSNIALAVPSPPHWFYGSVNINGSPAPDGTTVTARINGIDVASTTTSGGKYGYVNPLFYVPDTDPSTRPGETISFFVNGVDTGQTAIVPDFNDELPVFCLWQGNQRGRDCFYRPYPLPRDPGS